MRRVQIQGQMPMRFHKFLWFVSMPLGFLMQLIGVVNTVMEMTQFNWLYLVDFFYFFASMGLQLTCFIGFFRMTSYSWYGILCYLGVQVGYPLFCVLFCAFCLPDSMASFLGQLLIAVLYAIPVWVYYQKRKPLFFRPRWDLPAAGAEGETVGQEETIPLEIRPEAGAKPAPGGRGKPTRWLVAVLAVLCVVSCAVCAVLLVRSGREETAEPAIRNAVEAKRLAMLTAAEPEPEPEPEPESEPEPEPEPSLSSADRLANAAESVLYLETYDENGEFVACASGFLTGSRTLVTNYHVIQDAYELYGWTTDDECVCISGLLAYDEVADLAVLQCDWPPSACVLELADSDQVRQGLTVYAVGYPLGLANTMSNGIVSARYVDEYGIDTIQHTAPISPGNSGGPLLNGDGEVIGVNCAYYEDGQNLNLAVASNTLQSLLDQAITPVSLCDWTDRPLMPDQELWEDSEIEETP